MMRKMFMAPVLVLALAGCEVDSQTGDTVLKGAAVGAAGGAAAGLITGDFGEGLVAGAAAGAASGFVIDQMRR